MKPSIGNLTVYFEEPFWVGVFERIEDDKLSVCKVTFGAEPKDYEVLEYVLRKHHTLRFGACVDAAKKQSADNPKRRQREVKKQLQNTGIGTKSQQALAAQREETKIERKITSRAQKEAEQERRFALRQQKRKEKHKGH